MKRGLLVIMSGPSGVGKGTVRRQVMKDKSLNLCYSVSMTTRPKRPHEVEGRDYYFVSEEEFQKNIDSGNLLEWAEFVGHRYGTPNDRVEKLRDEGKNVLLEIEVKGTVQVMKQYVGSDLISIFLMPPSFEALEARIRSRSTESEEVIRERLDKARSEIKLKYHYEYIVLNDDVTRAADEIVGIIHNKLSAKLSS